MTNLFSEHDAVSRQQTTALALVLLAGPVWAAACGDGATEPPPPTPDPPRATTLTVTPATLQLVALGATEQLTAEVRDQNGNAMAGAAVSWASGAAGVATVNASGLVRGQAEGKATITASSGDVQGTSEIRVDNPDRAALVALYEATEGPNWVNNENWLTDAPLGDWYGIGTDGGERVTTIALEENALAGPIPPEIGRLANLKTLELSNNGLSGSIPSEIGRLANLEFLNLPINNLTGPLPPELGKLMNLWWLQLATNALEGPIPPEWVGLTKLQSLYIFNNDLTGPLPRSLLELENLNELSFGFNAGLCAPGTVDFVNWLNGREFTSGPFCNDSDRAVLRALFGEAGGTGWSDSGGWLSSAATDGWHGVRADSLGRVTALNLDNNGLVGRLPPNLGDLTQMTELQVGGNAHLVGRLPLSLAGLSLRILRYAGTALCTPVEAAFRLWLTTIESHEGTATECSPLSDRAVLEVLYAAAGGAKWPNQENWLRNVPLDEWYGVTVGDAGKVTGLSLVDNGLAGAIPSELGNLANLTELRLDRNGLSGAIPPELGDLAELRLLGLGGNRLSGAIRPSWAISQASRG